MTGEQVNPNPQPTPDILIRVQAVERLLNNFKAERILNAIIAILSILILLACAILFLTSKIPDIAAACGMVGSSGGIAATQGRLLKMWSDAMAMILK